MTVERLYELRLAALIAAGLTISTASAQTVESWYAIPFASYVRADADRHVDNDLGAGLAVGQAVSTAFNVELKLAGNQFVHPIEARWRQRSLSLDVLWLRSREAATSLYGVAAVGVMRNRLGERHTDNSFVDIGVGVNRSLPVPGMAIRADLRLRYDADGSTDATQSGYGDVVANVGIVFPIVD